ncbi:hypothetical protein [Cypionkella sp. TWP1-2-1b2]|uniref:hypothetical protein n=1 Tax=Cypionkella sp. TWP1-2-1b2 TaxID=2804675 RepID=UPI003CF240B6
MGVLLFGRDMATPEVIRDWRDNNGFDGKVPRPQVKTNQDLSNNGSNSKTALAEENTSVLISTKAFPSEQAFAGKARIRNHETATALCHAILACNRADACEIMAVAFEDLSIGMPIAPLFSVMDEAWFWASVSTQNELKAYTLACFTSMTPRNQAAFLAYVQQSRAA